MPLADSSVSGFVVLVARSATLVLFTVMPPGIANCLISLVDAECDRLFVGSPEYSSILLDEENQRADVLLDAIALR